MGNIHSDLDLNHLISHQDGVSGIYDIIMAYAISHLLPKHVVNRIAIQSGEKFERVVAKAREKKWGCFNLRSGSVVEGLCLPEMYHVTEARGITAEASDDDFLIIDNVYVDNTLEKAIANKNDFYLIQTYPGFARIRVVDPTKVKKELLIKRVENGEDVYYMSKHEIQQMKGGASLSGPAVSQDHPANINYNLGPGATSGTVPGDTALDLVYAVNIREWPDFMTKWALRQSICSLGNFSEMHYGFFLVGAAHRHSKDPEIEWRVSCSLPELFLARELTFMQKQAYMAFKYLVKQTTKGQKGIMTYHLKTTLFWTIERASPEVWRDDNLAKCLYLLLDNFINFLAQGRLPNYFIPESNLLEHLSSDHLRTTLSALIKLREDPLTHLMDYQRHVRLEGHSTWWHHAFKVTLLPHLQNASEILTKNKDHSAIMIILLRRCLFESMADVTVAKLSETSFEDTYDIMMNYLSLPWLIRNGLADLCFDECLYSFLVQVCRRNFTRTAKANTAMLFLDFVQRRLEVKHLLTARSKQRLTLLKACWNQLLAVCTADREIALKHWDQSNQAFNSFSLNKNDVVTIAEYSCFFLQRWFIRHKGEIDHSLILETQKPVTALQIFTSALKSYPLLVEYQFYSIWKLLSFNIDHLEPNITVFLESLECCYIPHEIIALLVNILMIHQVLLPNLESFMLQIANGCHCHEGNPEHTPNCTHREQLTQLQAFRSNTTTLLKLAKKLLYVIVMTFNGRITSLDFHSPGDRLISKVGVNFLLALAMMYSGCWEDAFVILSCVCSHSLPTDQVILRYHNVCALVILFAQYNKLPFWKALVPMTFHGNFQPRELLSAITKRDPTPGINTHISNPQNDNLASAHTTDALTREDHLSGPDPSAFQFQAEIPEENIKLEMRGNTLIISHNGTPTTYQIDPHTDDIEALIQRDFQDMMGDHI